MAKIRVRKLRTLKAGALMGKKLNWAINQSMLDAIVLFVTFALPILHLFCSMVQLVP
jgi:hypothetical protein